MSTTELFDTEPYTVPLTGIDDKDINRVVLRGSFAIELNRNDPQHVAWLESLTLGRSFPFPSGLATVDGKSFVVKRDENSGTEEVTETWAVKVHSLETFER